MNTLAVIPARGGSKRIPRKNIRNFLGEPVIRYSIRAAKDSGCFTEIMVSTDDSEIARVAGEAGALIPFMRSPETSGDQAGLAPVLMEVLDQYAGQERSFESVCCILPTAPFVTPDSIRKGMDLLHQNGSDAVIPVVRYSYPIQRAFRISRSGTLGMIWPSQYRKRSQDLAASYHDAGQFYWINTRSFRKQKIVFMRKTLPLEIPESRCQDIDNEEDWQIAEIKYKILKDRGSL